MHMQKPQRPARLRLAWLILAAAALVVSGLRWGGRLLIASDPLPGHVDAAVVLQGSTAGEKVRVAGAMSLLRQGITENILISIPPTSYWDEPVSPSARAYLVKTYGADAAQRVYFCVVGPNVDSTEGEAVWLNACIRDHGWKSIAVVTSNYHSRRAGMLWRKMLRHQHSALQFCVEGVPDPEFQPNGWWRTRLYAKTWFFEFTKLIWEVFS